MIFSLIIILRFPRHPVPAQIIVEYILGFCGSFFRSPTLTSRRWIIPVCWSQITGLDGQTSLKTRLPWLYKLLLISVLQSYYNMLLLSDRYPWHQLDRIIPSGLVNLNYSQRSFIVNLNHWFRSTDTAYERKIVFVYCVHFCFNKHKNPNFQKPLIYNRWQYLFEQWVLATNLKRK